MLKRWVRSMLSFAGAAPPAMGYRWPVRALARRGRKRSTGVRLRPLARCGRPPSRRVRPRAGRYSQSDRGQHGVVQAVGGVRSRPERTGLPSRSVNRPPASVTMIEHAAMSCSASSASGDVDSALGEQHVGPEVTVRAGPPAGAEQVDELLPLARLDPG